MSEPLRHLSPAEYLAFERRADTKHQYVGDEVFAMAGASARHNLIVANLVIEIGLQLRGGPCRVFPSDLRVAVSAAGPFFYPDVVALCAEPRFLDGERDTLLNPELVVEVLSPSTEAFDRGLKFAHYRTIPTLREVLFVAQDGLRVEQLTRRDEGNWLLSDHAGPEAAIDLVGLDCRVEVARAYDKVDLLPPG
jgi:Uma2 family endonuclease